MINLRALASVILEITGIRPTRSGRVERSGDLGGAEGGRPRRPRNAVRIFSTRRFLLWRGGRNAAKITSSCWTRPRIKLIGVATVRF